MKKTAEIICISVAVLLCIILFAVGSFVYETRYKITDIDSSVSPSGEYEVIYQNIGEPDFPFGYAHARLVLRRGTETVARCKFDVANDGGIPSAEQWKTEWKEDRVEVSILGEEQPDKLYTLYFNGKTEWKEPDAESEN